MSKNKRVARDTAAHIDGIRRVLMKHWDPLSVGDNANLADEYDSYIPAIYRLLDADCTEEELRTHIESVTIEMGSRVDDAAINETIMRLIALSKTQNRTDLQD